MLPSQPQPHLRHQVADSLSFSLSPPFFFLGCEVWSSGDTIFALPRPETRILFLKLFSDTYKLKSNEQKKYIYIGRVVKFDLRIYRVDVIVTEVFFGGNKVHCAVCFYGQVR